jgi:alpha-glucuronidase
MIVRIIAEVWGLVKTDRTIHAGVSSSGVSLWGSAQLADVQQYLALFAAFFGGLSAAAVFVYTCLKIWRLLKQPKALD